MYIGTATAALLALIAILVIIRRFLTRSAWLLQFYHTVSLRFLYEDHSCAHPPSAARCLCDSKRSNGVGHLPLPVSVPRVALNRVQCADRTSERSYTLVYIAYAVVTIGFYRDSRYQRVFIFFREGPWLLLWIAAWLCSVGTVSACESTSQARRSWTL